jgi:hypothetical protein
MNHMTTKHIYLLGINYICFLFSKNGSISKEVSDFIISLKLLKS